MLSHMKAAFILLSLAFAGVCIGLWQVMSVVAMLHRAYPWELRYDYPIHGEFESLCILLTPLLPFLAIPAVIYALFMSFRGKPSTETFCLFASVLALVSVILFFTVALACLVGWIPDEWLREIKTMFSFTFEVRQITAANRRWALSVPLRGSRWLVRAPELGVVRHRSPLHDCSTIPRRRF